MLSPYRILDVSNRIGWLAGRLLADLGAEVIKIESPGVSIDSPDWEAYNANKRLLRLDLQSPGGQSDFDRLIKDIDFLIDSTQPCDPLAQFMAYSRLREINPRLIHVSVTAFGTEGPRASWLATDLELMAAGGAMSLAGEPDSMPTRVTVPQSYSWAGAQAAVGALTALARRSISGLGQHVDVSAQASVILALSHAPAFWDMEGENPTRCGAYVTGRSVKGSRYRAFWPCADGYLNFVIYGGPAGRRTNIQLVEWMRERKADLGVLQHMDWKKFVTTLATQEEVDEMELPIAKFFLTLTKREFLEEASRREMLGYPVSTMRDIAGDPQLEARGVWQNLQDKKGNLKRHCGSAYVIDGKRPLLRYAPGEEVSTQQLLAEFAEQSVSLKQGLAA